MTIGLLAGHFGNLFHHDKDGHDGQDFSQGFVQGYQAGQAQARQQCENGHGDGTGWKGRGDDCDGLRGGTFDPLGNIGGFKGSFMEMLAMVLGQILDREQGNLMTEAKNLPGAGGSQGSGSSGSSDQSKISLFNAHAKQYESLANSLQQAMSAAADGNKTLSRGQ